MEPFIVTLALTIICIDFARRKYKAFHGASRKLFNYLEFSAGIGTLMVYIMVAVSCFITMWWVPLVAALAATLIFIIIPINIWGEMICACLWPVFFLLTIILMIV